MSELREADALFDAKRLAEAIPIYEAALQRSEKSDGATPSAASAGIAHSLGSCHYNLDNCSAAMSFFRRALAVEEYNIEKRVEASRFLADAYRRTSQLSLAEAEAGVTRRLIDDANAAGKLSSSQYRLAKAKVLYLRGVIGDSQGRPSDALLNPLEPALQLFELLDDKVGMRDTLRKISLIQCGQGLFELALATARRAESIDMDDLGVVNCLGTVLQRLGRVDEVLEYVRRELSLVEQKWGRCSEQAAGSIVNLGIALCAAGKADEGIAALRRSCALFEEMKLVNTLEYSVVCYNIGINLGMNGRPGEALPHFNQSLALRQKLLPPDHPDIANCLHNIAVVHKALDNTDAAADAASASIAVARRSQTRCAGPDCPRTVKEDGRPLEQCQGCKRTYYCSLECQLADWQRRGGHKAECKALKAETKAAAAAAGTGGSGK